MKLTVIAFLLGLITYNGMAQQGCPPPLLKFNGANHPSESQGIVPGLFHFKLTLEKARDCAFKGSYEITRVRLIWARGTDVVSEMLFNGNSLSVPFISQLLPGDRVIFQLVGPKAVHANGRKEQVKVAPVTWSLN